MTPHRGSAGFTLIEVLVALAVVATSLTAGLQASGALTRLTERQSLHWLARLCAQNALAQLRLQGQLPDVGTLTSSCLQAGTNLQVRLAVESTPNPSFRRVLASVATSESESGVTLVQVATVVGRY